MMAESYRTWLFAPGDHPERCLKALATKADQVIWDLEDAVAVDAKLSARKVLADLLATDLSRVPWIRVNGLNTAWGRDDLTTLKKAFGHHMPRFVLPKATRTSVQEIREHTAQWLLIVETAQGIADLLDVAHAWPVSGVARLSFGALDYRNEMDARETADEAELLFPRSLMVLASKVWKWPAPIDAVFPDIEDQAAVRRSAERARNLGMPGKMVIHPRQIAAVHEAYAPSLEEEAWARTVLDAAESTTGVVKIRGRMVDRPVIEWARKILAQKEDRER